MLAFCRQAAPRALAAATRASSTVAPRATAARALSTVTARAGKEEGAFDWSGIGAASMLLLAPVLAMCHDGKKEACCDDHAHDHAPKAKGKDKDKKGKPEPKPNAHNRDHCATHGTGLAHCKFKEADANPSDLVPAQTVTRTKGREEHDRLPIVQADLAYAPNVPPPIKRNYPVRLVVDMTTDIVQSPIDDSYDFEFWTFDRTVPGPFIRARVGDSLQINMQNKDPTGMQHNIDLHCVTGPGGGASLTTADQDEVKSGTFKLLYPGLYIYHCAVGPVGFHIGNGMYGLILVEPEQGMEPADKEFYVLQSEFYTDDEPVVPGSRLLPASLSRSMDENPNYVVFNGRVGSLIDEGTLKVQAGDRVRVYFGNAGPNLISSFHIIGTVFDKVYREGDLISYPARGLQTTMVPAGGATVVEFDAIVPGIVTLVDHSIWRVEKGCVGFIDIEGPPRPDIFHSEEPPKVCEGCKLHP